MRSIQLLKHFFFVQVPQVPGKEEVLIKIKKKNNST